MSMMRPGDRVRTKQAIEILGPGEWIVPAGSRGCVLEYDTTTVSWIGVYVEFDQGGFGLWIPADQVELLNVIELIAEEASG